MTAEIGAPAPTFAAPTDREGKADLAALKGRKVVLYFYPKDDTSGCTKEACGFRDALPDFSGVDATIIGVSKDSVAKHDKFKANSTYPSTWLPMRTAASARPMAPGSRNRCTARKYMGHRPLDLPDRREGRAAGRGGARSRCPAMSRRS